MSDQSNNAGPPAGPNSADQPRPQLRIITQYVKDLSFESPRPPSQLAQSAAPPQVSISVNVGAQPVNAERTEFEVELRLEAKANSNGQPVFIAELVYAALFQLSNVAEELKQPLTLIEGPRIIFPFARRVLADVIRDGGFPPLMIEPIDFAELYRRHLANQQGAAGAAAAPAGNA